MEWRKIRILTLPGFPDDQELDNFYGSFQPPNDAEKLQDAKGMVLSSIGNKQLNCAVFSWPPLHHVLQIGKSGGNKQVKEAAVCTRVNKRQQICCEEVV